MEDAYEKFLREFWISKEVADEISEGLRERFSEKESLEGFHEFFSI